MKPRRSFALAVCFAAVPSALGQSAPSASPAVPAWQAVQSPAMDPSKSARVENIEIVRDRIHIQLLDGTIQFAQPLNGVVFAAVFHGNGRLQADPPPGAEAYELRFFTKQDKLDMTFSDATFSFTDGFYDEVAKSVKWQQGATADDLYAKRQQERENLGGAYLPRLYKGIFSADRQRTAYFLADLKTREKGWVEVRDDAMQLEEIQVGRWSSIGPGKIMDTWMNFPAGGRDPHHAYDDPAARMDFLIPSYKMDVSVTDGAELFATSRVTLRPRYSGERVLLFFLDSNLRVSNVKDSQGRDLEFFQAREAKDRFQSYGDYVAVVLKDATQTAQQENLEFHYGGKRVVRKVGSGNYFCQSFGWYPAPLTGELGADAFAFRSDFELNFRSPKKYILVATGVKASETTDGKLLVTSWKSDTPLAAAGFAFGDYKTYSEKVGDIEVQVFANKEPDDQLASIQQYFENPTGGMSPRPGSSLAAGAAVGQLTPAALVKTIGIETSNTLRVFQDYFGPYPFKQIAVTNIPGTYGQGWPGLLYLSWLTFLDTTQLHALGIRDQTKITDFFRAHESSHQWWGHRVGWKSYHDQWLSEGFAEFSGILYVQFRRNPKEFFTQLRKDKELLHRTDVHNHTADSLGPIWMGRRIASSETNPGSYQDLIYSKGAYVLQMIRMQLYDSRNADPDHFFKELMHDYCKTFENKPASTEDFKAIVEKHMASWMDLDRNHKMDWFFNQYVYGTGIPQYTFRYSVTPTADGKTQMKATLERSGVPDTWKDVIPLYGHAGDKTFRLGAIAATHPTETIEATIAGKVDKLSVNDYEDLLAGIKQ